MRKTRADSDTDPAPSPFLLDSFGFRGYFSAMAPLVLLAGASGRLGQALAPRLRAAGWRVRGLTRRQDRSAAALGVDEVAVGDLLDPDTLPAACQGADLVFSCAGGSLALGDVRNRTRYSTSDYQANRHLLATSRAAGVRRFAYVSVLGAEELGANDYAASHARMAREVRESELDWRVIEPTGFFGFFREILEMARKGRGALLGDGSARTNPIAEEDLADVCVAALGGAPRTVAAGGPEVLTRRDIGELAFQALGRTPKLISAPPGLFLGVSRMTGLVNPRLGALLEFGVRVSTRDVVAPAHGSRTLGAYFERLAAHPRAEPRPA